MNNTRRAFGKALLLIVLLSTVDAGAYEMKVDRFEVSGPSGGSPVFVDEFTDGLPGGWTNSNGLLTFGTWEELPGTGFASLKSPGLLLPKVPGFPVGTHERSDIFSHLILASRVAGGEFFHGIVTLGPTLPTDGQAYLLSLNFLRPGAFRLSDNVFVGLVSASAGRAAAVGLPGAGLYFFQAHIEYGPALNIAAVTDIDLTLVSQPAAPEGIQLRVGYVETAGSGTFSMGYRFAATEAFLSPLPPIAANVIAGHWDIGTALAVPEPSTYALVLAGLGLVGYAARRRRRA